MEHAVYNQIKPFVYGTPWTMFAILIAYLYFVLIYGPKYMKRRKPYDLKKFIITHNITQVVSCIYVVYEILDVTDNRIFHFWRCNLLPATPERIDRYFKLAYFIFWLKVSELIETVVFVLRKKQNQISALHVFHHCSTVTLVYLVINHNSNGYSAFYPPFLNSIIHIIMYTYYLIAAVADSSTLKRMMPIKKSITVMQMVQFSFILLQAVIIKSKCRVGTVVLTYYSIVIAVMFYGFYDFYQKSYKKGKAHKSQNVLKKAAAL